MLPVRRRSLGRRSAVLLTALALLATLIGPAAAQPSSQEVRGQLSRAQERLDELELEAATAVEDYNQAAVALEEVEAELASTEAELAALRSDVERLSDLAEDHVRRIHKLGPSLELSSILVSGDPTEAGAKATTLRRIVEGQRADLEQLGALRDALTGVEQRLEEQRAEAERRADELEERRAEVEATLAAQADEIAELEEELRAAEQREEEERRRREEERLRREAEERARRAAEEQARREAAAAEREAAERREREAAERDAAAERSNDDDSSGRSTEPAPAPAPAPKPEPKPEPAPSVRKSAQVAVDTALAQVGKPYQWGGSGPNSFDCSGLTSYAWRAAGVEITRTSRSQWNATRRVSRSELQPGDLVFHGSSPATIGHVAMYIGGGRVVEAPRTGLNVRVRDDALSRRDILGFGRP